MKATDKCRMRQAFDHAGVSSPRFACWTPDMDPVETAAHIPFPLVVKPVDNMGARGVMRIDRPKDLASACGNALVLSRSSRVIIEEYMEGPELSLDAIVHDGEITVCGIADRHICFEPHFVEMGHTMPAGLDESLTGGVEEVFRAGIRAIGIDDGAAKGDIKLTASGPKIGEIAARLSGGFMSGWTFPMSCGVEVTAAALNIAVGLPPGDLTPKFFAVAAERAIISIPGTVREVEGMDLASRGNGVREIFLRVEAGSSVVFPTNNVEKCGNVITACSTRAEAIAAAVKAVSRIRIRLRPLTAETDRFLFGSADEDGRSAFALSEEVDRKALSRMPPYWGSPPPKAGEPFAIQPLPAFAAEKSADWHGVSIQLGVRGLIDSGHAVMKKERHDDGFTLGSVFWKALLRGGTQGALYLLDGIRSSGSRESVLGYISRICT
jgi:biotin carboxylase